MPTTSANVKSGGSKADVGTSEEREGGGEGSASNSKSRSSRAAPRSFLSDVRTDRAWRVGLTITLPLAIMHAFPSTSAVLSGVPTFLFTIAAYNYIPSVGGALSLSLFWAWHGLLSLPVLTALAYVTATLGTGALFAALVGCALCLQPVLGTQVVTVFLLHSSAFVMGTLDAALGTTDPSTFVLSLWGPQGRLTYTALSCVLLVPFTTLPFLVGPLLLSSRHAIRSATDVLAEVASAHRKCATLIRNSFTPGEQYQLTEELGAEMDDTVHSLLELEATLDFMKDAITYSRYEPALWPIGGIQIPNARWMALHSAANDLLRKTAVLLRTVVEEFRGYSELSATSPDQSYPVWLREMADVLDMFAKGVDEIEDCLDPFSKPFHEYPAKVACERITRLETAFSGLKEVKLRMMSSVHEANIKGFPAVVERIESHLSEGANTDEELVKLATDILRLRDSSLGDVSEWSHSLSSSGTANHGKLLLDGLQVRDHIMVAIMNASSVELRSSLLQSATGVLSWIGTDAPLKKLSCNLMDNCAFIFDGPYSTAVRYVTAARRLFAGEGKGYFSPGGLSFYVQFVSAYSALYAMNIFWTAWTTLVNHQSFSAWQLATLAVTLMPTVEPTLKKGIASIVGVPLGGLIGLAILITTRVGIAPLSVTVELLSTVLLFVSIATFTWFQPLPNSGFKLSGLADVKVAMQQAGASLLAIATAGVGVNQVDLPAAILAYVSKTTSLTVGIAMAMMASLLIFPHFTYSNVRLQMRDVLEKIAMSYAKLSAIFFDAPPGAARPLNVGFGKLAHAATLESKIDILLEDPLASIAKTEAVINGAASQLMSAMALLKGTDAMGSSWMHCLIKCTSDKEVYSAVTIAKELLLRLQLMAHTMQATTRSYGIDSHPSYMLSYRTGIGHFEPMYVRYNPREKELATRYCEASLRLAVYEAQAMLLVSAEVLFHSPSFIDLTGLLATAKCENLGEVQKALKVGTYELSGLIASERLRKEVYLLHWMLNTMQCVRARAEGFEQPTKMDMRQRLHEVTSSLLHEHTFSAFMASFHSALQHSKVVTL